MRTGECSFDGAVHHPCIAKTNAEEKRKIRNIEEITPDLKDAGQPLEDVATAGQPEAEHFERLAETGYKTVVDMRAPEEDRGLDEPEIVRRSGMEYVSIPVGHETVEDETFDSES